MKGGKMEKLEQALKKKKLDKTEVIKGVIEYLQNVCAGLNDLNDDNMKQKIDYDIVMAYGKFEDSLKADIKYIEGIYLQETLYNGSLEFRAEGGYMFPGEVSR